MFSLAQYQKYQQAIRGERLPLAFVDLDAFDSNIAYVRNQVESLPGNRRTVRVGSKSLRCEPLIRRIFDLGGTRFHGLLTFTVEESAWLASKGYTDLLVAYPSIQPSDLSLICKLLENGIPIKVMADSLEHLKAYSDVGVQHRVVIPVCLELDVAYRPFGKSWMHLGLRRSPLRTPQQVSTLVQQARQIPGIHICALMGYEGHIAGTSDAKPGAEIKNRWMRWMKQRSMVELTRRRQQVVEALHHAGLSLELVNGGGSGSLRSTLADPSVTEITVGSAFYCPALFHHFQEVHYQPAAFFALQVARLPTPGMITCQGGGYPASGAMGQEKLPLPVLPPGLKYLPLEGAGEVQTPLTLPPDCPPLTVGDVVFFQHAKAGELCERFNELLLLRQGKIIGRVPTYRGEGYSFL